MERVSTGARLVGKVKGQRWRLATARLRAERAWLARAGRKACRGSGRVLSYHGTGTPGWGVNDVLPPRFLRQVELAQELGYRFVPASQVASGKAGPRELAITFDDGLRSILAVLPWLDARRIPYTIFVVTAWSGLGEGGDTRFLGWSDLRDLQTAGAEVGSHSCTHASFRTLTPGGRVHEIERSRADIARELGVEPALFAIPFGRAADWEEAWTRLAREAGYAAVFAQAEDRRSPGTVGRSFVSRYDGDREFRALLDGRFDRWEEWF